MRRNAEHISSEELLLFLDGELGERHSSKVRRHLAGCSECRTSIGRMQETLSSFIDRHQQGFEEALPPMDGSRAILQARIWEREQLQSGEGSYRWHSWAALFASAAAVAGVAFSLFHTTYFSVRGPEEPNARLTPGVSMMVTLAQVCVAEPQPAEHDDLPASVKRNVFERYGMQHVRYRDFEVDHLITRELGGTNSAENLWPEPYYDTVWNARVKDQLEVHLRQLVCSGQISLATAQHDLASDWIGAYRKYFQTQRPVGRGELRASSLSLRFATWTGERGIFQRPRYHRVINE